MYIHTVFPKGSLQNYTVQLQVYSFKNKTIELLTNQSRLEIGDIFCLFYDFIWQIFCKYNMTSNYSQLWTDEGLLKAMEGRASVRERDIFFWIEDLSVIKKDFVHCI